MDSFNCKTCNYCLAIQGKRDNTFTCRNCNKSFLTKHWLQKHRIDCVSNCLLIKRLLK